MKFHLKGKSPKVNQLFSVLPIPFFVGLPGFYAKFWCAAPKSGDFHGFYKWQTAAHAEAYANSFAMEFIAHRSVPGSVLHEIVPYEKNRYGVFPDHEA